MNINRGNYGEFIKDDNELKFVLGTEKDPEKVVLVLQFLQNHLQLNKTLGNVENFSIEENRIEIETSRYTIYMLVLHSGDVSQYTINKRTNKPANYSRRMFFNSALDTLDNYLN